MVLTNEEIRELKDQLREQTKSLSVEKREEAERQIDEMSAEALESMIEQQRGRQQIFRMIANKEIDSVVIEENSEAIAVLELNPVSEGHTLVIPKKEIKKKEDMTDKVISFAEKIIKKIETHLKPKKVDMVIGEKMGEAVIDLIPFYDKEVNVNSERKQSTKEELGNIKKKLNTEIIKKVEPEKIKVTTTEESQVEKVKIKRRIP